MVFSQQRSLPAAMVSRVARVAVQRHGDEHRINIFQVMKLPMIAEDSHAGRQLLHLNRAAACRHQPQRRTRRSATPSPASSTLARAPDPMMPSRTRSLTPSTRLSGNNPDGCACRRRIQKLPTLEGFLVHNCALEFEQCSYKKF